VPELSALRERARHPLAERLLADHTATVLLTNVRDVGRRIGIEEREDRLGVVAVESIDEPRQHPHGLR